MEKGSVLDSQPWTTAQRRRIGELVLATAGLELDQRASVLDAEPSGDGRVLAEVRRRLAAADALPDDYLESPLSALLGAECFGDGSGEGSDRDELRPSHDASFGGLPAEERYELIRPLGSGGMAEVHEAMDRELDRRVALKRLRAGDPETYRRFQSEARAQARVQHDHVLEIYEAGLLDHRPYIAMRLVQGGTLGELAPTLGLEQKLRFLAQAAEGLHAAHRRGLLHHDVKPSNILIGETPDGEPRAWVSDFGIAVSVGAEADSASTGLAGTPQYMAPERIGAGAGPSDVGPEADGSGSAVDRRADVFSFGVTLYQVLSGALPFEGTTPLRILHNIRNAEPIPLTRPMPSAPADLQAIVETCLAKEPERRYGSMRAVAEDLRRFLDGEVVEAYTAGLAYRLTRFAQRHRLLLTVGGVLGVALMVALAAAAVLGLQAIQAKAGLERRQAQAEGLVSFMLGDLRDGLAPLGRLDLLDKVGARAMEYFAQVPEHELSSEELARRSEALYQIGDVRIRQGDLPGAQEALRQSLDLAIRLSERDPGNSDRLFGLGQSYFWLGYSHWEAGDLTQAEPHLQSYLQVSEALVERRPDHADYRLELSNAQGNLGFLLQERADFEGARERFEQALSTLEPLPLDQEPDDPARLFELAAAINSLAVVSRILGRLPEAHRLLTDELELRRRRLALNPEHRGAQEFLATSLQYSAGLGLARGQIEAASDRLEEASTLLRELTTHDPDNGAWVYKYIWVRMQLAQASAAQGKTAVARELIRDAMADAESLVAKDPSQVDWRRAQGVAHVQMAQSLSADTDASVAVLDGAEDHVGRAVAVLQALVEDRPEDRQGSRWLAEALLLQAQLDPLDTGSPETDRRLRRAHDLLAPWIVESRDYELLDPWARTLEGLGRDEESRRVADQLSVLGYRRSVLF